MKYSNSLKMCMSIYFDILKPDNKKNLVPVPKNAANFNLVDE